MSQPSRAERRRTTRGGATPPPAKRDPMTPIYIGFAIVIVLVLAGFGISNFISNQTRAKALAFDYSTPTPGPQPTTKPIALVNGQPVGKPIFGLPTPNPQKGILPDTASGGHGQLVDGIPCATTEAVQLHVHSHLAIMVDGSPLQIPPYIGFALQPLSPNGSCLYWLHTHDASGIIHIEAGDVNAPNGGPYTVGMFFDIWGQPLSRDQVGPFKGKVTAFVNGQPYDGDLRAIPLRAHQGIVLEVGEPVVPPPTYIIPAGE
ncbi:MAG TPA: hypothetical protein VGZ02_12645 [Candidatus Baltobacteraceae bacterium]|jgi:hypothetical protein|nr:hypothetical protein [Candidatus Baltobacteraceae bacterium]